MKAAFGIFQGGGAMGVAHIGALRAAEEEKYIFAGVAGASAGALVATLVAVGYNSDEIFEPKTSQENIFDKFDAHPLSILGVDRWKFFQRAKGDSSKYFKASLFVGTYISGFVWRTTHRCLQEIATYFGYFEQSKLRKTINDIIRAKLWENSDEAADIPEWICFRDIDPDVNSQTTFLKIITTDVVNQCPQIFSHDTPDVIVADAVLASISIPFLFPPVDVQIASQHDSTEHYSFNPCSKRYVDGGIVANLPAWVFSEEKRYLEREVQDRVPIFAFELGDFGKADSASNQGPFGPGIDLNELFNYCNQIARTAIFGNQRITDDLIADLYVIPVRTSLPAFNLALTVEAAKDAFLEGYGAATTFFVITQERQRLFNDFLSSLKHDLEQLCVNNHSLRACIIEPIGWGRYSFRISASVGMENDADDGLLIDSRNKGAPTAFKSGKSVFASVSDSERTELLMTKYEFSLVRDTLCSMICVPVFPFSKAANTVDTSGRPRAVIAVDSDGSLSAEYDDQDFMACIEHRSAIASRILFGSQERESDDA